MHASRQIKPWINFAVILAVALAFSAQTPVRAEAPADPAGFFPIPITPAPPGCQATTNYFERFDGQSILDFSTYTTTIPVSGLQPYTWNVVASTAISHTYNRDLNIYLSGPNEFGFQNTLSTGNGGSADNVFAFTFWNDLAQLAVTDMTFANNVSPALLVPEGAMGAHVHRNPNGIWQLVVSDVSAHDEGTLNSWGLMITTLPFEPIVSSQTFNNNTAQAIPKPGTVTSTITVSNAGTFLDEVTVNVEIPHTQSGQLIVTLMAPNGLTTTLTSGNGGSLADLFNGADFTDHPVGDNAMPVTDVTYVDGESVDQVQPEGAMRHFAGGNPNGTWKLIVKDSGGLGSGTLKAWQMAIFTSRCEAVYLPAVRR